MIDIGGIGNQKMKYRDHKKIKFMPMDEYWSIAKKILNKFGRGIDKTDDVISYVANAVMMADWRWDSEYKSKDFGRKKDLYSYRNQCGLWAIKTLKTKAKKDHAKSYRVYSLDNNIHTSDNSFYEFVSDNNDPSTELEAKESTEEKMGMISSMLKSDLLSAKEKDIINKYYYEEMTLEQIGTQYNLTREAIRQNIIKTIDKIKKNINV